MSQPKPDYDAMFAQSQQNPFIKEDEANGVSYDAQLRKTYAKKEKEERVTNENPEVLDAAGRPLTPKKRGVSAEWMALISLIIGAVALVLVFVGMFLHAFLWIDIVLCAVGIGFGAAALLKNSPNRIVGVFGVALSLFVLLVDVICLIVVGIIAGVSAISKFIF